MAKDMSRFAVAVCTFYMTWELEKFTFYTFRSSCKFEKKKAHSINRYGATKYQSSQKLSKC